LIVIEEDDVILCAHNTHDIVLESHDEILKLFERQEYERLVNTIIIIIIIIIIIMITRHLVGYKCEQQDHYRTLYQHLSSALRQYREKHGLDSYLLGLLWLILILLLLLILRCIAHLINSQ
jgi:flagellar biosynthesis/type III secretory pathway M-ring protein FliF/YscJ